MINLPISTPLIHRKHRLRIYRISSTKERSSTSRSMSWSISSVHCLQTLSYGQTLSLRFLGGILYPRSSTQFCMIYSPRF